MRDMKREPVVWGMIGIFALAIFYLCGICRVYAPAIMSDEFGYWAHAAQWIGFDWKNVSSIHPYYSFGYGLILAPIMKLFRHPVLQYRAGVTVNFVLLGLAGRLLYGFLKGTKLADRRLCALCTLIAMAYPSYVIYALHSLTETMLLFWYLVVLTSLQRYLATGKPMWMLTAAGAGGYLFWLHMRCIGIGVVLCLVMFMTAGTDRRQTKTAAAGVIVYALMIAAALLYKAVWKEIVYAGAAASLVETNDFAGQAGKIVGLFTLPGIRDAMISAAGKFFYLGSATGGLFYWGIWLIAGEVRKRQARNKNCLFMVFLLLSTLSAIGISAVAMMWTDRIDGLIYGRYNEYVVPPIMALGLLSLIRKKRIWRGTLLIVCLQSVLTMIVIYTVAQKKLVGIYQLFIPGAMYAFHLTEDNTGILLGSIYVAGSMAALAFTTCAWLISEKKLSVRILAAVFIGQVFLAQLYCEWKVYPNHQKFEKDIIMAERILNLPNIEERKIQYVFKDNYGCIDDLQFGLQDKSICVVQLNQYGDAFFSLLHSISDQDILVMNRREADAVVLKKFSCTLENAHFIVYYNE